MGLRAQMAPSTVSLGHSFIQAWSWRNSTELTNSFVRFFDVEQRDLGELHPFVVDKAPHTQPANDQGCLLRKGIDPDAPRAHRESVDIAAMRVGLGSGLGAFLLLRPDVFDVVGHRTDRLADVSGRCAPGPLVKRGCDAETLNHVLKANLVSDED